VIAKVIGGLRRTRVTKITRWALSKTQETRKERAWAEFAVQQLAVDSLYVLIGTVCEVRSDRAK
jgi:hypothetical protein